MKKTVKFADAAKAAQEQSDREITFWLEGQVAAIHTVVNSIRRTAELHKRSEAVTALQDVVYALNRASNGMGKKFP